MVVAETDGNGEETAYYTRGDELLSMDSYQGSIYDPVSLHKYLYVNANPVMYTDPSGYAASTNLTETTIAAAITVMLVSAVVFHDQAMMNIFANLRRNLASSAALLSWRLFEAIYATDNDVHIPGVPVYEDEKEIINGIPAEEQSGSKIYSDYITDNRVPMDNETILGSGTFQKTKMRVKGAIVYKKGNRYYYRDTFHTGKSAHLEEFNKSGHHLGEADPKTGELRPGTADSSKKLNIR